MRRHAGTESAATLLAAALFDLAFGEPSPAVHPVVAIGRLVAACERRSPRGSRAQLAYGAALGIAVPAAAVIAALAAERALWELPLGLRLPLRALTLKPAFAVRALLEAGDTVERDLRAGELVAARQSVRSLVSRDPSELDAGLLAAAAIESLAENLTDSIVAPLLAAAAFGLPGAYAYRAINTLDSMIGYRGRYEWLGKVAARLDDAANLVPARLAAVLLMPAAGGAARRGLRSLVRDHGLTASPNSGWTMAVMAGALDVRLEKPGHYVLNRTGRIPAAGDIARARTMVTTSAGIAVALAAAIAAALSQRQAA
jgi:adenosylcobinamide-phosphate synthase